MNAGEGFVRRGNLFIVSAPSGAGKTTLCTMLCRKLEGIEHSVSYTTRPPRKGEMNNTDYTFVGKPAFLEMAGRDEFLEWAEVHGNFYGTSKKRIVEMRERGVDVIMDIDTQGAGQLMAQGIEACFIFVLPPSLEELNRRLETRNTDTDEVIQKRLIRAREEIQEYKKYEYVIINDSLDRALDKLMSVVKARRCSRENIDHAWIQEHLLGRI